MGAVFLLRSPTRGRRLYSARCSLSLPAPICRVVMSSENSTGRAFDCRGSSMIYAHRSHTPSPWSRIYYVCFFIVRTNCGRSRNSDAQLAASRSLPGLWFDRRKCLSSRRTDKETSVIVVFIGARNCSAHSKLTLRLSLVACCSQA